MLVMLIMLMLFFGVLWIGLKLAWSAAKFVFGIGLLWFCPLLFVIAVLFGWFSHLWIPILIVGLLFGGGFRRGRLL